MIISITDLKYLVAIYLQRMMMQHVCISEMVVSVQVQREIKWQQTRKKVCFDYDIQ